ncbi:hypothetical protein GA0070614_4976 [Micromonospora coxensis]|uniref:DUF4760 domain-containing protein n=2 Tax=Micromonospora coxensis TaxID=356852 RepID=A0A1C5JP06_9ACTN|nr:hypothetical protein GA0070614_4976 [Micromonospora coxensis]
MLSRTTLVIVPTPSETEVTATPSTAATATVAPTPSTTPAGSSNQDPTLSLVVGIVGIVGTLSAALVTQWLTARREDKKWQRDREQDEIRWRREAEKEDLRWERERAERREQWQREDESRWHKDRMSTYSHLLGIIHQWIYLARDASPNSNEPDERFKLDDVDRKNLADGCHAIGQAIAPVEFLAPVDVRWQAWRIYSESMRYLGLLMESVIDERTNATTAGESVPLLDEIQEWYDQMTRTVRKDLGIKEALVSRTQMEQKA